jgi:predicted DNA binding CopG/RHH family protein
MTNKTINDKNEIIKLVKLTIPTDLLIAVRQKAKEAGLPYQKYIRMTLENAVNS